MCLSNHNLRFCTCEEVNEDGSMSYWQLHRNIAGEQIITMGTPAFWGSRSTNRAPWLRRIRRALDSFAPFDFDYTPQEGDHLSIHIVNEEGLEHFEYPFYEFGYVYTHGRWQSKPYDSFTWMWEAVETTLGCVKSSVAP